MNARASNGDTALMSATRFNDKTDSVKELLAAGADINAKNRDGITALMNAAREGKTDIVNELLAAGAKVNEKDNNGKSALTFATQHDHSDIVKLLLAAGAK